MNNDIKKRAYELYKLDWMASHGHTLQDIAAVVAELSDLGVPSEEVFSEFEQNGFSPNGEIYVCFDEFVVNEYQDMDYMRSLLSKEDFKLYLKDLDKESEPAKILLQKAESEYCEYLLNEKEKSTAYKQIVYAYIHIAIKKGDLDKHAEGLYTMDKPIEWLYEEIECDNDLLYSCIVDYLNFRLEDTEVCE